ncbi:MAG TPA: hypothetical protein VNW06_05740 [Cytophagaceae bacterium]|jgi:hypothetical protein|nr:hypothetical protein [Cytophagaceae bacterium]
MSRVINNSAEDTEDIVLLKAQYGEIFRLCVYLSDDDTAIAYLKKPTRAILGAVMSKMSTDPMLANEILLRNCIITELSDNRILDIDEVFISAIDSLDGLVNVYRSDLKKI